MKAVVTISSSVAQMDRVSKAARELDAPLGPFDKFQFAYKVSKTGLNQGAPTLHVTVTLGLLQTQCCFSGGLPSQTDCMEVIPVSDGHSSAKNARWFRLAACLQNQFGVSIKRQLGIADVGEACPVPLLLIFGVEPISWYASHDRRQACGLMPVRTAARGVQGLWATSRQSVAAAAHCNPVECRTRSDWSSCCPQ